ncbi:uncharacterized protein LOC129767906 [Toxorhynchites rutilus septentrionalis]|uniref:uncharacterized protein LOC129767906 n=1 Tax=Toxorhynchites rutilus septentrionalis TaxID=329112 RepID=UPI00247A66BD|nr:uncharacterized protein LOC129767906 [Toxorhynchites rutilus septentrionalis]XP_055625153.1 uncharacterized protein LOC129767906 [Toxorhynchites rutilus septentrionalis]XP_055625154.1 uncharacterized protein LOC129767906 [Toxorhynchites rutilus septentrionalis]
MECVEGLREVMSESVCIQETSSSEKEAGVSPARGSTWHNKLLLNSRNSTPYRKIMDDSESLLSGATESYAVDLSLTTEQHDVPSRGLGNESYTNYDSGNFSFSDCSKAKPMGTSSGGLELHQRFVQLNTELYQTKTELLTYKYKWNEIRHEVELEWNKKYQRVVDDSISLQQELEDFRNQLQQAVEINHSSNERENNLEKLSLQSKLDQLQIQLDCKDRANGFLKKKIAEQYCDKENLSLELRKLEKLLAEATNEVESTKSSASWFRNELHGCQNVIAKLKENNVLLESKVASEKANCDRLKAQMHQVICSAEEVERKASREKEELLDKLRLIEASNCIEIIPAVVIEEYTLKLRAASDRITNLTSANKNYELEIDQLQSTVQMLKNTITNHELLLQTFRSKESEMLSTIQSLKEQNSRLGADKDKALAENSELHTAIAREGCAKRDLDVSIDHLRAQLKVLSINFENTRRTLGVKEFALEKLQREYHDLRERSHQQLERCRGDLEAALKMNESSAANRYDQLLENFTKIQSTNLNLEVKLGQYAEDNEKFRKSEEVVHKLRQDIAELQKKLEEDVTSSNRMSPSVSGSSKSLQKSGKSSGKCPKHGNVIPEDDTKELKILLKVIESETRHKLKRYELNNRTLLRKVKEHCRARKMAEHQVQTMENDVQKMTSLQCELARFRERNLLLEADLEKAIEECQQLKGEKTRLMLVLQGNCLLTADENIWASFQRIFADLRDKQFVHKENGRLRELLKISESKIQQLEEELRRSLSSSDDKSTVIENLKLTTEMHRVETDEVRSMLKLKSAQLEDSQKMVDDLSCERNSLQDSIGSQQLSETKLKEEIDCLRTLLQVSEIQLDTASERVKLFEESERILTESRQRFFDEIQTLRDEIIAEKQEKYELQEMVRALKANMMEMVECSLKTIQSSSQPDSTNSATSCLGSESGEQSAVCAPSIEHRPPTSIDEAALRTLIEECSRPRHYSLRPLQECVASLRAEMSNLNAVVRHNGQQRNHVISLMEELQDATNGTYNSR